MTMESTSNFKFVVEFKNNNVGIFHVPQHAVPPVGNLVSLPDPFNPGATAICKYEGMAPRRSLINGFQNIGSFIEITRNPEVQEL